MDQDLADTLLTVAREAVTAVLNGRRPAPIENPDERLTGHQGCFVTLKTHGQLRGCIGQFTADRPLIEVVQDRAVASATQDPRFVHNRLQPEELDDLRIEISVLSPLQRIANPLDIELGVHGILIQRGGFGGCFLPQVATETGWTKEEFLGTCCSHKAGLPHDAWKDPATEVHTFTADIISEPE